jgi:hypothetical protein
LRGIVEVENLNISQISSNPLIFYTFNIPTIYGLFLKRYPLGGYPSRQVIY